jgi:hypothetical protein
MTFSGRPSEAGEEPAALDYAKITSLAFWDAYLKSSEAAKKWLLDDAMGESSDGAHVSATGEAG